MFDSDMQFALQNAKVGRFAPRDGAYRNNGKRLFDILFVLAITPVLVPVIALLAVLVRMDGGSAFFGHARVGKHGQMFTCWKLRTMVPNAEARLRAHLETDSEANYHWQKNFKLVNDPRVTRLGSFLRKTSLDELPQFWNVLIGDMSVVGPRPSACDGGRNRIVRRCRALYSQRAPRGDRAVASVWAQ
jgi:exopolysaccharide production protein ExoY